MGILWEGSRGERKSLQFPVAMLTKPGSTISRQRTRRTWSRRRSHVPKPVVSVDQLNSLVQSPARDHKYLESISPSLSRLQRTKRRRRRRSI